MSGHTPGPWEVGDKRGVWVGPVVMADNGKRGVAFVCGDSDANAHLIAAAPDLLHACQAVANDLHRLIDGDDFCGMSDTELFTCFLTVLEPALDKAEGRINV